jgi:hypothetical protein
MPCYRCGTRQVDPERGESPWRRGVRGDRQVLICPGCQAAVDWTADLDRCAVCSSVHLLRRLGEAECRDCGSVGQPVAVVMLGAEAGQGGPISPRAAAAQETPAHQAPADDAMSSLTKEVEEALSRVLGTSTSPRPPYAMS